MQTILFTDVSDAFGYGKYAGTYKIATEIRNAGYTCQVVDLFSKHTTEKLIKIIDKFVTSETILIGISGTLMEKRHKRVNGFNSTVYNFGRKDDEVRELLQYAKSKNPKIKVVVGGARVTARVAWDFVDFAILNKGDIAIVKLIEHLLYGTNLPAISADPVVVIDGSSPDYFYTQENFRTSKIIYEPQDIILPNECLPIEVARGCIFSCAYCHFDLIGKKIGDWQKAEDILREELLRNYELFGTTDYMISDELVNESMPKMELIHKVFTTLPFKISFTSYARLDMIYAHRKMRDLILDSGAISLSFGIETMNDTVGKIIGKGLGRARTEEILKYCSEAWKDKLLTSSMFITGLPGESEESLRSTVDWLASDNCTLDVFGFIPLSIRSIDEGRHASKIDKDPKKYGYVIHEEKPWDWKGQNMSYERACELAHEFHHDPRIRTKTKFIAATWMGRLVNVGYTLSDIFKIVRDPKYTRGRIHKEIEERTFKKNLEYYQKLMEV